MVDKPKWNDEDESPSVDFDADEATDKNVPTGNDVKVKKKGKPVWDEETGHVDFDADEDTDTNVRQGDDKEDWVEDAFEDKD